MLTYTSRLHINSLVDGEHGLSNGMMQFFTRGEMVRAVAWGMLFSMAFATPALSFDLCRFLGALAPAGGEELPQLKPFLSDLAGLEFYLRLISPAALRGERTPDERSLNGMRQLARVTRELSTRLRAEGRWDEFTDAAPAIRRRLTEISSAYGARPSNQPIRISPPFWPG